MEKIISRTLSDAAGLGRKSADYLMPALLLALLSLAGGFTVMRNQVYRSEITLWEDTVRKSPAKPRAWNNLGYAYFLAGRETEARAAYRAALLLQPDYPLSRANLARVSKAEAGADGGVGDD